MKAELRGDSWVLIGDDGGIKHTISKDDIDQKEILVQAEKADIIDSEKVASWFEEFFTTSEFGSLLLEQEEAGKFDQVDETENIELNTDRQPADGSKHYLQEPSKLEQDISETLLKGEPSATN